MNQSEAVCNHCQTRNGRFQLHHLRDHGRRLTLCTLCVLKLHREFFCPICFQVYGSSSTATSAATSSCPALVDRLMCSQCPSMTHTCCAKFNVNGDATVPAFYICPICSDPKWFDPETPLIRDRYFNLIDGTSTSVLFDEVKANGVMAAAKIVEEKMRKISDLAKKEAEKKAAIAVEAQKRAKEALKALRAKKKVGRENVG